MKNGFKLYIAIWSALLVLFNVIAFASVGWIWWDKYTDSFWIGYAFITLSFIGQLVCSIFAFKADSAKKMFYNISLVKTSFTGLILSFVFGGLCMLISPMPYWAGIILCVIVLIASVLAVARATAAVSMVTEVDEKVKNATFAIKALTLDAEIVVANAKNDFVKAEAQKIYEALRYSDPMSNEHLVPLENEISSKLTAFSVAAENGTDEEITAAAKNVLVAIEIRNSKCKLLK